MADDRTVRTLRPDRRAVSPVVGKVMEAAIVVLYIGLLSSTLYGGLVPDYRTAAGAEVGERVLAESAQRVQQAVPPNASRVRVRAPVELPTTVRGTSYEIRATGGRTLVLDHPHVGVGGRTALALPNSVVSVAGEWESQRDAFVVVRSTPTGLEVRLVSGGGERP